MFFRGSRGSSFTSSLLRRIGVEGLHEGGATGHDPLYKQEGCDRLRFLLQTRGVQRGHAPPLSANDSQVMSLPREVCRSTPPPPG